MNEELIAFAKEVNRRAGSIYGAAGSGKSDKAAELAISLMDYASTVIEQKTMREEVQTGEYDLSSLPRPTSGNAPE